MLFERLTAYYRFHIQDNNKQEKRMNIKYMLNKDVALKEKEEISYLFIIILVTVVYKTTFTPKITSNVKYVFLVTNVPSIKICVSI